MDIAQFKRERQRLYAKRSYYRQLIQLNMLKEQVTKLEQQYATLRRERERYNAETTTVSGNLHSHQALAVVKTQLLQEQRRLRQRIAEYEAVAAQLAILSERMEEDKVDPAALRRHHMQSLIDPLTPAECLEMGQDSHKDVRRFIHSGDYMTTGARVFGWEDRRQVDGNLLRFALTKRFTKISPMQLSSLCWPIFSSPKHQARLYSPSLCAQFRVMQVVDANNVVMLGGFASAEHKSIGTALILLSRMEIVNGYLHVCKPLARERMITTVNEIFEYEQNDLEEQWFDIYSWVLMEESDEDCKVYYGGTVSSSKVISMAMWMLEILFITLRFEAQVFGPIFSLPSSE